MYKLMFVNLIFQQFAKTSKIKWYWIDVNDKLDESIFVDSDNKEIGFRNFTSGQPNGSRKENCLAVNPEADVGWNDVGCDLEYHVICEKHICAEVKHQINYISTKDQLTYADALAFCENKKMDLLFIENAVNNTLAHEYAMSKGLGDFWIQGTDVEQEGDWVDGQKNKLPFRNWHHQGLRGNTNYNCIVSNLHTTERWWDTTCSSKWNVICQPKK